MCSIPGRLTALLGGGASGQDQSALLRGLEKGLPECTGLDSGTDAEQGLMDGEGRCDMVRRHFPAGHHGQVEN